MSQFTTNSLVSVYPFSRQIDGEEIIIGRADISVFLALPLDAIDILDSLANGKTVGETQLLYQEKYSEVPDIEDFLNLMEQEGFVGPQKTDITNQTQSFLKTTRVPAHFHFTNFPQSLAQKLFSRPALIVYSILIILALASIVVEPSLIPGWDALLFKENITLMRLIIVIMGYTAVFLHEMAHLVAARAVGVLSRLGISNRMWVLVAETDMTGMWSIPRNQRYIPFLAGPLLDAVSASILVLVFFTADRGLIIISPVIFLLGRAMLLRYLLNLLWQCYFFVRTDFYYVIASIFKCKNLMSDTTVFLRNQISKIIPLIQYVDQSNIPNSEMQFIRWYTIIWIIGRIAALYVLFSITIPLLYNYCVIVFSALSIGYQNNPYKFIDAILISSIFFVTQSIGLCLWIRSLIITRR
jgi:hypothetical protein